MVGHVPAATHTRDPMKISTDATKVHGKSGTLEPSVEEPLAVSGGASVSVGES